jgi:hypothetical protein
MNRRRHNLVETRETTLIDGKSVIDEVAMDGKVRSTIPNRSKTSFCDLLEPLSLLLSAAVGMLGFVAGCVFVGSSLVGFQCSVVSFAIGLVLLLVSGGLCGCWLMPEVLARWRSVDGRPSLKHRIIGVAVSFGVFVFVTTLLVLFFERLSPVPLSERQSPCSTVDRWLGATVGQGSTSLPTTETQAYQYPTTQHPAY